MTTDPIITIAGLTAERDYFEDSARSAAASAVSQGAYMLRVTAERDALAAQLAEVRATVDRQASMQAELDRVSADRVRIDCERADAVSELARTCRDLASERAHLAACQTRIAGLEQAANERSKEVARLTTRVAELEARPVNARAALISVLTATKHGPGGRGGPGDCDADCVKCEAERALASLGAPPTSPPAAIEMRLCEAGRVVLRPGTFYRFTADDGCEACRDATATSPPVARQVFAGVSASDLDVAYIGGQRECHQRHQGAIRDCCRYAAVRAVLDRLEVSLVAPVDPEAVALRLRDHAREIGLHPQREPADYLDSLARLVRVIFRAAGIPVTPEPGK